MAQVRSATRADEAKGFDGRKPGCLVGKAEDLDDEDWGEVGDDRSDRGEPGEDAEIGEDGRFRRGEAEQGDAGAQDGEDSVIPAAGHCREQGRGDAGQNREPGDDGVGRGHRHYLEKAGEQCQAPASGRKGLPVSASPRSEGSVEAEQRCEYRGGGVERNQDCRDEDRQCQSEIDPADPGCGFAEPEVRDQDAGGEGQRQCDAGQGQQHGRRVAARTTPFCSPTSAITCIKG